MRKDQDRFPCKQLFCTITIICEKVSRAATYASSRRPSLVLVVLRRTRSVVGDDRRTDRATPWRWVVRRPGRTCGSPWDLFALLFGRSHYAQTTQHNHGASSRSEDPGERMREGDRGHQGGAQIVGTRVGGGFRGEECACGGPTQGMLVVVGLVGLIARSRARRDICRHLRWPQHPRLTCRKPSPPTPQDGGPARTGGSTTQAAAVVPHRGGHPDKVRRIQGGLSIGGGGASYADRVGLRC
jgi:hypothetical protein